MSPEYCRPPSAMIGMPVSRAASDASYTAVTWGTPTPATTRVVQIEPGPTPTFTASAPASMRAWAPDRVATFPPMTSIASKARSPLSRRMMSRTPAESPLAVSTTITSTPASRSAPARSQASPKNPIAAPTRRRPSSSLVAFGYCSLLSKSLTVMSPPRRPLASTRGSFSILCWARMAIALSGSMPTGAVIRGAFVMTSLTRVVLFSKEETKRMSRLVMMPTRRPSPSTTGSPETRN